ncbi:MAG: hypothetical protein NVS9B10_19820 [Nevskia sp.]
MTDPVVDAAGSITVVYVMDVADRPGIAHAIAAVFAHRGLSMRALIADAHRRPPRILVVFNGTPRQARLVAQVLARLHDIHGVRMLPADSAELRAVALCRGGRGPIPDLGAVSVQQLGEAWLLSGSYVEVETALAILCAAGLGGDVSRSLVAL